MATKTSNGTRKRSQSTLAGELRGDTGANALSTTEFSNGNADDAVPDSTSGGTSETKPSLSKNSRRSRRRKFRSCLRRWKSFSFRHTWVNPLILIILILSAYLVHPDPANPISSAIFLAYPLAANDPLNPRYHASYTLRLWPFDSISWANSTKQPVYYGKGPRDFAFVAFYIVVLSFTREFLMQRVLRPLAFRNGIRSRSKQNRFMEQAYTAIYFAVFGPLGLYVMSRTPVWYFNTRGMYEGFPHRSHEALFKAYYLLQASYWAQQAIVLCLQLEKPRKDFKELVGHHIVTLALIGLSYMFHFTYMGLAVYITHDISDFFLATSKVLNYIASPIIIPYFSLFMVVWTYMRHYLNIMILYSVTNDFATVGPFTLDWDTQQYKCWISQYITFALLAALQSLNIFWMYFITKIAVLMVGKQLARDIRSDDEEDEGDELEEPTDSQDGPTTQIRTPAQPHKEVDSEAKDAPSTTGSNGVTSKPTGQISQRGGMTLRHR